MTRLEVIRPFVEQTVKGFLGVDELDDGTIPIRAGSSPELLGRLNELNASLSFARTFLAGDVVYISMDLLAETLDQEQVAHVCALVSFAADHWDNELKDRFGGQTFFADEGGEDTAKEAASSSEDSPGGYL